MFLPFAILAADRSIGRSKHNSTRPPNTINKAEPRSYFTATITPLSTEGDGRYGLCPVYAARVVFEDKQWRVTDRTFRPAEAMFLSVVSTSRRGGDPDGFIPLTRLMLALVRDRT